MLENNNRQVIAKMALRSLKSNRRRNLIIIAAVTLSAFMLFSVLTVGVTYFKMQRLQNIRLNGAEFDAIMYGVTKEQENACANHPDIAAAGITAVAGHVRATKADSTPNVGLLWADGTYWQTMMAPAREWVEGSYPQSADEVMVTQEALEECGLETLGIGDSFEMEYGDGTGNHTAKFRISGIWGGHGPKRVFFMSEAFYEQSGWKLSDAASGRYYIEFRQNLMSAKAQADFTGSMNLGKQQTIIFTADIGHSVQIFAGMAGLIVITCFCAYLLIYNIMYLSVSGNIRYYGLLQTVGMTGKQLYRLLLRQIFVIGAIGIAAGIVLGSIISLFVIPEIIRILGIRAGDIQLSFHPLIFLLTVLLAGLTIYISCRKPAKKAVSISPVEATGYQPLSRKKTTRKTGRHNLLWQLAWEQLTKDKKKSAIVILSLAASLSVFLCLVTLIESQGARTIVSNYSNIDMTVKNDTLNKEDRSEWIPLIDEHFIEQIRSHKGVAEVNTMLSAEIIVPWEPDFSDIWMREFYEMWMSESYDDTVSAYKAHPEEFSSQIIGINEQDFNYLNDTLETPIDKERFLTGETCLLLRNGLDFTANELAGKQVSCEEYGKTANVRTFEIAGLLDDNYYIGARPGFAPMVIVSDRTVTAFISKPFIFSARIGYLKKYDEQVETDILKLMDEQPDATGFSYESKLETMQEVKEAQGNSMEIGIGIVMILALIGILNYINTVAGNIQGRQIELAIMESVGMTERQVKKMLMLEGTLFAAASLFLTATVGIGITYAIYQSMNYQQIAFSIPIFPMLGMTLFILAVCISIPLISVQALSKKNSVVERIRGFE